MQYLVLIEVLMIISDILNHTVQKTIMYLKVKNVINVAQRYPRMGYFIGSGINYTKKGLLYLIDRIMSGDVERVVVLYKDRLIRFGYELL